MRKACVPAHDTVFFEFEAAVKIYKDAPKDSLGVVLSLGDKKWRMRQRPEKHHGAAVINWFMSISPKRKQAGNCSDSKAANDTILQYRQFGTWINKLLLDLDSA